jgi:UDP-glucose 4-epimerase
LKNILVIGGAGYIGSHIVQDLALNGYSVTVLDNLSSGFQANLPARVKFIYSDIKKVSFYDDLKGQKFEVVFHFASKKAAGESMTNPALYSQENIMGTLNLISNLDKLGAECFIFSSSAAVYGDPEEIPITEEAKTNPLNYYGYTKLAIEQNLQWYAQLMGIKFAALRYFNAAGYDIKGRITKREKYTANLLPMVLETIYGYREKLLVFGDDYNTPDGSCIRDYIHVNDLSSAHIKAMYYLITQNENLTVNLGTGNGYSVFEVLEMAQKLTGKNLNYEVVSRRAGDPPVLISSAQKAKDLLNWQAEHSDLKTIINTMIPLYIPQQKS